MENVMVAASPERRNDQPARPTVWQNWPFWLGLFLLVLALLAFLYEVIAAAGGGGYRAIASGELWFNLHPYSLNLSQAVVQRYLLPSLWDPVIVSMLQWPAWSILGAPGAILAILFYPRTSQGS